MILFEFTAKKYPDLSAYTIANTLEEAKQITTQNLFATDITNVLNDRRAINCTPDGIEYSKSFGLCTTPSVFMCTKIKDNTYQISNDDLPIAFPFNTTKLSDIKTTLLAKYVTLINSDIFIANDLQDAQSLYSKYEDITDTMFIELDIPCNIDIDASGYYTQNNNMLTKITISMPDEDMYYSNSFNDDAHQLQIFKVEKQAKNHPLFVIDESEDKAKDNIKKHVGVSLNITPISTPSCIVTYTSGNATINPLPNTTNPIQLYIAVEDGMHERMLSNGFAPKYENFIVKENASISQLFTQNCEELLISSENMIIADNAELARQYADELFLCSPNDCYLHTQYEADDAGYGLILIDKPCLLYNEKDIIKIV